MNPIPYVCYALFLGPRAKTPNTLLEQATSTKFIKVQEPNFVFVGHEQLVECY